MFRQLIILPLLKVLTFLQRHWLVLSLVLLGVLTIIGLVLPLVTPQLPQNIPSSLTQQGNTDGSKTTFLNMQFSGVGPKVPEKMWIATVGELEISSSDQLLNAMTEAFELEPSPHVADVWIGTEYSLEFDRESNEYRLTKNVIPTQDDLQLLAASSINSLIVSAESSAKKIFPSTPFVSFPNQIQLLLGGVEYTQTTLENATSILVPFGLSYYNIPVLFEFERDFPMTIIVDAKGEITKIVARPFSATFEPKSQHSSLSIAEAMDEISEGNASIISSYSADSVNPTLDKVVRGEFSSVTLEYRIDPTTNLLIPYYHFVGTLVNIENDIFSASVITPAVRLSE